MDGTSGNLEINNWPCPSYTLQAPRGCTTTGTGRPDGQGTRSGSPTPHALPSYAETAHHDIRGCRPVLLVEPPHAIHASGPKSSVLWTSENVLPPRERTISEVQIGLLLRCMRSPERMCTSHSFQQLLRNRFSPALMRGYAGRVNQRLPLVLYNNPWQSVQSPLPITPYSTYNRTAQIQIPVISKLNLSPQSGANETTFTKSSHQTVNAIPLDPHMSYAWPVQKPVASHHATCFHTPHTLRFHTYSYLKIYPVTLKTSTSSTPFKLSRL